MHAKMAKGVVPYLHPYEKRQLIEAWERTQWTPKQLEFLNAVRGKIWRFAWD